LVALLRSVRIWRRFILLSFPQTAGVAGNELCEQDLELAPNLTAPLALA